MKRSVTVNIGEFSARALADAEGQDSEHVPARLVRALRLYLHDRDAARPGWAYPQALPEKGDGVEIELTADEDLWSALEREAGRQDVTVSQLVGHAALYYAAELDAGNITQRILEQLDDGE